MSVLDFYKKNPPESKGIAAIPEGAKGKSTRLLLPQTLGVRWENFPRNI